MTAPTDRARAPRRSPEDVVAAALALLAERGLPDLSMRNIAASLGVQASALYWHFPNKQTLLAAVADALVTDAAPAPADTWQEAAITEARALRARLLSVRDGAELVASALALGLGGGYAAARLRAVFALGGFAPEGARRAGAALVHFVLGHTMVEQQRAQARELGVDMADADAAEALAPADEEAFEIGLLAVVTGLEVAVGAAGEPVG